MKRVLILFTLLIVVSHGCTERDSALAILDTIDRTTLTTQKSRAHHALLNAMALDKNFVDVYRYNKYRRISGFARRVDVRDLVDTTSYTPILFNKGALPIYDVPITWFEINSEQIGMEEGTMTTYICYYAFIIPEDKIYVIEE